MKMMMRKISLVIGMLAGLVLCPANAWGKNKVGAGKTAAPGAVRIMVVGLPDNVSSNYYPISMISEETGIAPDSVDVAYNSAIAQNIISNNKDERISFFVPANTSGMTSVMEKIGLKGDEAGEKRADLSRVGADAFRNMLARNDADYVLFLNQHYLKWQEKPMQTVFHITSFSLFDGTMREVLYGNNNFTSINLENREKLRKDARKSSSKILSTIVKKIPR